MRLRFVERPGRQKGGAEVGLDVVGHRLQGARLLEQLQRHRPVAAPNGDVSEVEARHEIPRVGIVGRLIVRGGAGFIPPLLSETREVVFDEVHPWGEGDERESEGRRHAGGGDRPPAPTLPEGVPRSGQRNRRQREDRGNEGKAVAGEQEERDGRHQPAEGKQQAGGEPRKLAPRQPRSPYREHGKGRELDQGEPIHGGEASDPVVVDGIRLLVPIEEPSELSELELGEVQGVTLRPAKRAVEPERRHLGGAQLAPRLLFRDARGPAPLESRGLLAGNDLAVGAVGRCVVADVEVDAALVGGREPGSSDEPVANRDRGQDDDHAENECRRASGERFPTAAGAPGEREQERYEEERVLAKEREDAQERPGTEPLARRPRDREREQQARRNGHRERLLEELHVVEQEWSVQRREAGRNAGPTLVGHRPRRSVQRVDPDERDRDLNEVDRIEPVPEDGVDRGQSIRVERRLEEDLRSDPVSPGDLLRPPVVLLAIHRELGEERPVVDGDEVSEAKGERRGEDHREPEPARGHGRKSLDAAETSALAPSRVIAKTNSRRAWLISVYRASTSRASP